MTTRRQQEAEMERKLRNGEIQLRPYQRAAVELIKMGAVVKLPRGAGKTITAIAARIEQEGK